MSASPLVVWTVIGSLYHHDDKTYTRWVATFRLSENDAIEMRKVLEKEAEKYKKWVLEEFGPAHPQPSLDAPPEIFTSWANTRVRAINAYRATMLDAWPEMWLDDTPFYFVQAVSEDPKENNANNHMDLVEIT